MDAIRHLGEWLVCGPFWRRKHYFQRFIDFWFAHKHAFTHSDPGVLADKAIYPNDTLMPILTICTPDFGCGTGFANDFYNLSRR
jgi:hypothetical protein